jgi:hypothetical protein
MVSLEEKSKLIATKNASSVFLASTKKVGNNATNSAVRVAEMVCSAVSIIVPTARHHPDKLPRTVEDDVGSAFAMADISRSLKSRTIWILSSSDLWDTRKDTDLISVSSGVLAWSIIPVPEKYIRQHGIG